MIYLDYSATTPVNKEVIDTYSRVCSEFIGNPNSLHKLGIESKGIIDAATKQIADLLNIKENERLSMMNHSCAHLMAQAVKHLYPQAKFWVGPVIEEGFYYDIDLNGEAIKDEDLEKIEKEI